MGIKWSNILKIIVIATLSLSMISCSSNKVTSDDFTINSSKIDSDDGNYTIALEFYEKAGTANYTIYENDKEIKSGRKDEKGKETKELIFTDKANGEYLYKVKVEDENSGIVNKEVKVKVENDKTDDDKPEDSEDKDEVEKSKETPWNKESIEYKVKDKVSYKDKTYECTQAHTSQEAWTPLDAPSLWKVLD